MYSRVYVEITNICNRSCSFCPGTVRSKERMTVNTFRTIAERLQGVTQYLYLHIMGEPLTHPELPQILAAARELGFRPCITTNGTLLPQRAQELLDAGVYKFNISLHSFEDGTREAHEKYILSCARFARQAGQAGSLAVLRLWNNGFDGGLNDTTGALLRQVFPEPWEEGPRGIRLADKVYLEYGERFDWPDLAAPEGGEKVYCYGLKDHFGILCDGTVVPCCLDREGELALGNIFDQPITEILDSPRAKAILEGFRCRKAPEELCRKCGYARRF
jgi:radical SAM protein with 4Fe4S-binding SPASM domain